MYSFGSSETHANAIKFGDLAAMDAPTAYTLAMWMSISDPDGDLTSDAVLFDKWDSVATTGWSFGIDSDEKLQIIHGDSASTAVLSTSALGLGMHSIVLSWNGSNATFHVDGVADGTPALTRAITANAKQVRIGNSPALNVGFPGSVGHVMWWDKFLNAQERAMYHAGVIPQPSDLKFWAPGWTDPGIELVGQATAVKEATVTIVEDALTTVPYFFGQCGRMFVTTRTFKEYTEQADITDENAVGLPTFTNKLAVGDREGLRDGETSRDSKWDPDGNIIETMPDGTVWTKDKFPPYAKRNIWTED